MPIANTPDPPYYAVIFTSIRTEGDNGYAETAARMEELATQQPGYLGIESARGITVSYWRDLESIRAWKSVAEHVDAQLRGQQEWYESYTVRICRVERECSLARQSELGPST